MFTKMRFATFYMRGGHTITVGNVESVELTRDATTGGYAGYTIKWEDPTIAPELFSLSIPDIVAVSVEMK